MKKQIKVKVTLTDGYSERFTKACIKVAKKKVEQAPQKKPEKIAV